MAETKILDIDFGDLFERLAEIKSETLALKEANEELKKSYEDETVTVEEYNKQLVKNEAQMRALNKEQRTLQKAVDDTTKAQKAQKGSIEANRAELARLTAEYVKLAKPTKEQTQRLLDLTNRLKQQESAFGDTRRNVGNYTESINAAIRGVKIFGIDTGKIGEAMKIANVSVKGATGSVRGFSSALVATGIGAIIVALGYLIENFDKVKKAFAENREEVNKWAKILFLVSPAIGALIKGFQLLQDNLAEVQQAFAGLGKVAEAVFDSFASAADAILSGNFSDVSKAFEGFGSKLQAAFEKGRSEEQERQNQVAANEILKAEIERNKLRLNVLEAQGKETAALRLKILKDELSLLDKGSQDFLEKQNEIDVLIAQNISKQAADRKKNEEDKKKEEEQNAKEIERIKKESLQKQLADSATYFAQQELIEKQNLLNGIITQEEFNKRLVELKQDAFTDQILILETFGQETAAKEIELENLIVDAKIAARDRDFEHQQEINEKIIEHQEALLAAEEEIQDAKIELANQVLDTIGEIAGQETMLGKISALAQSAIAIVESTASTANAVAQSNAALATIPPILPPGIPNPAYPPAFAHNVATKIQLGVSLAQSIAKIKGAISMFEEGGEIPVESGVSMYNIGGRKHSQGGTKFYGEDGNVIEMEQGEKAFVLKASASKFLEQYSTLNRMFGGKSWRDAPVRHAAAGGGIQTASVLDGGFAARESATNVEQRLFMKDMFKSLPPPIVRVSEINRVQGNVQKSTNVSEL